MTPQHELTGSIGPGHGIVHKRTETDPDHLLARKPVDQTREHPQRVFRKRPGMAEQSARPEHRWSGHDRMLPVDLCCAVNRFQGRQLGKRGIIKLANLHPRGALTDEEFRAQKAKLLA